MLSLKKNLESSLKNAKRIAILGIGSSLKGDDASGLLLLRNLKVLFKKKKKNLPIKLFSCGTTPENHTGSIKQFNPSHIIIIDAANFGKRPGSVRIIDPEEKNLNVSFSSHGLPLQILIDYLVYFLNCQILLIGIQPESIEFGDPLSEAVKKTTTQLAELIMKSLDN